MNIGYTAHNLENHLNVMELVSMIENNVIPDFIIFHQRLYKRKLISVLRFLNLRADGYGSNKESIIDVLKNVPIYNISSINSKQAQKVISKYNPAVIIANSGIISKSIIKKNSDILFINKHASKLPMYRGVSNIEWATWDNEPVYGSFLRIHHGIDEGDILYQEPLRAKLTSFSSFNSYRDECQRELFSKTGEVVSKFLKGDIILKPQSKNFLRQSQYYSMHPIIKESMLKKLRMKS